MLSKAHFEALFKQISKSTHTPTQVTIFFHNALKPSKKKKKGQFAPCSCTLTVPERYGPSPRVVHPAISTGQREGEEPMNARERMHPISKTL